MRGAPQAMFPAMLWLIAAMPAQAQARYHCNFTRECSGTTSPCQDGGYSDLVLEQKADGWHLWGADETDFWLMAVPGGDTGLQSWASVMINPDTQTAALLSISGDGQAFLSLHETFPAPQASLQTGTCARKDRP